MFVLFGMEEQPEFVSSNTFAGTLWFRYLFSFVVVPFLFSLKSSFSSLLLSKLNLLILVSVILLDDSNFGTLIFYQGNDMAK